MVIFTDLAMRTAMATAPDTAAFVATVKAVELSTTISGIHMSEATYSTSFNFLLWYTAGAVMCVGAPKTAYSLGNKYFYVSGDAYGNGFGTMYGSLRGNGAGRGMRFYFNGGHYVRDCVPTFF